MKVVYMLVMENFQYFEFDKKKLYMSLLLLMSQIT